MHWSFYLFVARFLWAYKLKGKVTRRVTYVSGSDELKNWFIGEFDNRLQSTADEQTKPNIRGYRHEFVTGKFIEHFSYKDSPMPVIVAFYYYGKNTSAVFRLRYYQFEDIDQSPNTKMKLYRPTKEWEDTLRSQGYQLDSSKWPSIAEFEYLKGCDVVWERVESLENSMLQNTNSYRGYLNEGKCEICSQSDPTLRLTIRDDLNIWKDELWINDRVYKVTGEMIIGNIEGIPYKLKRVL